MAVRTRNDLARVMAPKMGMTHQESERYLKELIAEMTKALKNGDEIVFRGFGRLMPKMRKALEHTGVAFGYAVCLHSV